VPDASILSAIGRGHSLETAIADTVDNSIDAGARSITIRFVTRGATVTSIEIRDDGIGMTATQLESAMTLGKQRAYEPGALGHFGMGLKASAMSQGRTLTVYTSCGFEPAIGMRLSRANRSGRFEVDVLNSHLAEREMRGYGEPESTGTVVVWSGLESVSQASAVSARHAWLEDRIDRVRKHLGLIMHRLLQKGDLQIEIEVYESEFGEAGVPRAVAPIDPFGFTLWGKSGYPQVLRGVTPGGTTFDATCYILPPNSLTESAKIFGLDRRRWQGIYVYRNDRILQPGGWLALRPDGKADYQLARVALDLTPALEASVVMNPEKHDVRITPDFAAAIEAASDERGTTLSTFLDDARSVQVQANKRDVGAKPVNPIGSGIPEALRALFGSSLRVKADAEMATFGWKALGEGRLFEVDAARSRIWLNAGYRRAFSSNSDDPDDAAFLKLAIFFAVETRLGRELRSVNKEQLEGVEKVLASALLVGGQQVLYDPVGNEWDPDDDAPAPSGREEATLFNELGLKHPADGRPSPIDVARLAGQRRVEEAARAAEGGAQSEPAAGMHGGDDAHASIGPSEDAPVPEPADEEADQANETNKASIHSGAVSRAAILACSTADDATPVDDPDGAEPIEVGDGIPDVTDDPVRDYLRQIGRTKLLNAAAEVDMAVRIEAGLVADEKLQAMTQYEQRTHSGRELAWISRDGGRAFNEFVTANLRLVVSIAKRYAGRGLPFLDLIQEGNIGLIRAVEKFDYMQGNKFSTYATWWIRQSITRALADQSRMIRIPAHVVEDIDRIRATRKSIGGDETVTEAAVAERLGVAVAEVASTLAYDRAVWSLDADISDADRPLGSATLADLIEDGDAIDLVEAAAVHRLPAELDKALGILSERDSQVLRMRYGLDGDARMTYEQIGDAFGVTRERIRQIEKKSLEALRTAPEVRHLGEYLGIVELRENGVVKPADAVAVDVSGAQECQSPKIAHAESRGAPGDAPQAANPAVGIPMAKSSEPSSAGAVEQSSGSLSGRCLSLTQDVEVLEAYRRGDSVNAIARELDREPRAIVTVLVEHLLGVSAVSDDASLATRAGEAYGPNEKDRLVAAFRDGQAIERIAQDLGRTPFAIAWQLIASPRRPVHVVKRYLRQLRQAIVDESLEMREDR